MLDEDDIDFDWTEPPMWQPPKMCPACRSAETRFVEPRFERAIYECEACHTRFEDEG